jgi:hypothetical protein
MVCFRLLQEGYYRSWGSVKHKITDPLNLEVLTCSGQVKMMGNYTGRMFRADGKNKDGKAYTRMDQVKYFE